MAALLSFHGDAAIKRKYLARVRAHAKADEIVKGQYWEGGKGCAVGCTIHSGNHSAYQDELGLPEWLARLEDTLFEGLPNGAAKAFPAKFLAAIPVGKNLDRVKWRFSLFLLGENAERVAALKIDDKLKKQVLDAIKQVVAVNRNAIDSGEWNDSAAESARSAWSAAWSAARSAAESALSAAASAARSAALSALSALSAAASAAWSAALSAAASTASAARSAARSAAESAAESARSAWSAAESAAYVRYADKLLELLKTA